MHCLQLIRWFIHRPKPRFLLKSYLLNHSNFPTFFLLAHLFFFCILAFALKFNYSNVSLFNILNGIFNHFSQFQTSYSIETKNRQKWKKEPSIALQSEQLFAQNVHNCFILSPRCQNGAIWKYCTNKTNIKSLMCPLTNESVNSVKTLLKWRRRMKKKKRKKQNRFYIWNSFVRICPLAANHSTKIFLDAIKTKCSTGMLDIWFVFRLENAVEKWKTVALCAEKQEQQQYSGKTNNKITHLKQYLLASISLFHILSFIHTASVRQRMLYYIYKATAFCTNWNWRSKKNEKRRNNNNQKQQNVKKGNS